MNQLPAGTQQPALTVADRPDHRRDVYRLLQRRAAAEPDHRLPGARGASRKLESVRACRRPSCSARKNFALRAWLDPDKLAALRPHRHRRATGAGSNNYISGLGTPRARWCRCRPDAPRTDLHSLDEFRNLVRQADRRRDRAAGGRRQRHARRRGLRIRTSPSTAARSVFIGIKVAPAANLLDVIQARARGLSRTSRRSCPAA